MFTSIPLTIREIKATEAVLERIYNAAYDGLKGDSLALAAGLHPTEYNRLLQFDPIAETAEKTGRADAERDMARVLLSAAKAGDHKAALEVLKHAHGWVAKQAVSVEIDQRISVIDALRAADERLITDEGHQGAKTDLLSARRRTADDAVVVVQDQGRP
jgi:hypothetical protein